MKNRFTVPIAVAVAVHATLLFGFRKSAPVARGQPVPEAPRHTIAMEKLEDPVKVDIDARPIKGAQDVDRPTIDDSPRKPTPTDLIIDKTPPTPQPDRISYKIDPMPPGNPNGDDRGIRFDPNAIVTVGGLDNPPNARVQNSPDYPFAAVKEGTEGQVVVEFVVDETGRVSNPFVVSSTHEVFEQPSLRAVLKWRFEPGKRHGQVVRFRMSVPVVFRLDRG